MGAQTYLNECSTDGITIGTSPEDIHSMTIERVGGSPTIGRLSIGRWTQGVGSAMHLWKAQYMNLLGRTWVFTLRLASTTVGLSTHVGLPILKLKNVSPVLTCAFSDRFTNRLPQEHTYTLLENTGRLVQLKEAHLQLPSCLYSNGPLPCPPFLLQGNGQTG